MLVHTGHHAADGNPSLVSFSLASPPLPPITMSRRWFCLLLSEGRCTRSPTKRAAGLKACPYETRCGRGGEQRECGVCVCVCLCRLGGGGGVEPQKVWCMIWSSSCGSAPRCWHGVSLFLHQVVRSPAVLGVSLSFVLSLSSLAQCRHSRPNYLVWDPVSSSALRGLCVRSAHVFSLSLPVARALFSRFLVLQLPWGSVRVSWCS